MIFEYDNVNVSVNMIIITQALSKGSNKDFMWLWGGNLAKFGWILCSTIQLNIHYSIFISSSIALNIIFRATKWYKNLLWTHFQNFMNFEIICGHHPATLSATTARVLMNWSEGHVVHVQSHRGRRSPRITQVSTGYGSWFFSPVSLKARLLMYSITMGSH